MRAVGENAETAFASGRNPATIKYQALFVGGLLAGLGAAHLSIAFTMNWAEYMTGGRGFIAIALVIFSKWHPIRAIAGVLVFSGAVAFQLLLQVSGVNVSPFHSGYDSFRINAYRTTYLGRNPQTFSPCNIRQGLSRY